MTPSGEKKLLIHDKYVGQFKVMVRPLQAINLLHIKMKAMLESMQAGAW